MSAQTDYTASRMKVARAGDKLAAINGLLQKWADAGISLSVRQQFVDDRAHVIARVESELPAEVSWELVEAVGHLRSSLDKAVVSSVLRNGESEAGVGFPFWGNDSEGKPNLAITPSQKRLKEKLTPQEWDYICQLRPYRTGNNILWSINQIANIDKHRSGIVKAKTIANFDNVSITNGRMVSFDKPPLVMGGDRDYHGNMLDNETLLLSFARAGDSRSPEIKASYTCKVIISAVEAEISGNIADVVREQIHLVGSIIDNLEQLSGR